MKIRVFFKTPDAVENALDSMGLSEGNNDESQMEALFEAKNLIEKYVRHGENVLIEFDTETKTAEVVEV